MSGFRIALMQTRPVLGELEVNLSLMRELAAPHAADLFVYPELATTGYALTDFANARAQAEEPAGGSGLEFLQELAEEKSAAVIAGLPLHERGALFNASALLRPGMAPVFYRKLHLFYREKDLFTPGDRPPEVWEWRGLKLGMMICYDWVYPETARIMAHDGADLIVHPANLVLSHCQRAMVTRSLENGVFTATVNRIGEERYPGEDPLVFTGGSQVTTPRGELTVSLPVAETAVRVVEIDPAQARGKSLTTRNHLFADRRADIYGDPLPDRDG
ncbi:MAG: hypothetical protein GY835_17800 [bacterium]|nr:hypothetical protein [bacterium]